MENDDREIRKLRDSIVALKHELAACAVIGSPGDRELLVKYLQDEIAYLERVLQLKTDEGEISD